MTASIYATATAMIAPAQFLTATASLMISTATRIARIVDRIRVLVEMCDWSRRGEEVLDFPEERRKHALDELRRLQSRSNRAIAAVTLLYMALGSFAATSMAIAIDSMAGRRIAAAPTLFAIAGVALLLAASANLVVEARTALRSNDLEAQFFFELERLRGDPVIDASAGPDHRLPTDPASRHAEPVRDDALGRSEHGT
jgi:ABC-type Na+ efflux pump permease subunit